MKNLLLFFISICLFISCQSDSTPDDQFNFNVVKTILLVRHAEKVDLSKDPPLSEAGMKRAERLGAMLKNHPIKSVFSSDYDRTRSTAAPVSRAYGLNTQIYETDDLTLLKKELLKLKMGEMAVVVGHSNTTPVVVNLLDNKGTFEQIDESDYENIFLVKMNEKGEVSSIKTSFDAYEKATLKRER
jgi:phosphohistidine phosphatase SixA